MRPVDDAEETVIAGLLKSVPAWLLRIAPADRKVLLSLNCFPYHRPIPHDRAQDAIATASQGLEKRPKRLFG